MSGIYPSSGQPPANAINGVNADTTDEANEIFYDANACNPRFDPAAQNALMSELLNLMNVGGHVYDATRNDNLLVALQPLLEHHYDFIADAVTSDVPVEGQLIEISDKSYLVAAAATQPADGADVIDLTGTGLQALNIGPVFHNRTEYAVTTAKAHLVDGQTFTMNGFDYVLDSTLSLAASVTNDLNCAGVCFNGDFFFDHLGVPPVPIGSASAATSLSVTLADKINQYAAGNSSDQNNEVYIRGRHKVGHVYPFFEEIDLTPTTGLVVDWNGGTFLPAVDAAGNSRASVWVGRESRHINFNTIEASGVTSYSWPLFMVTGSAMTNVQNSIHIQGQFDMSFGAAGVAVPITNSAMIALEDEVFDFSTGVPVRTGAHVPVTGVNFDVLEGDGKYFEKGVILAPGPDAGTASQVNANTFKLPEIFRMTNMVNSYLVVEPDDSRIDLSDPWYKTNAAGTRALVTKGVAQNTFIFAGIQKDVETRAVAVGCFVNCHFEVETYFFDWAGANADIDLAFQFHSGSKGNSFEGFPHENMSGAFSTTEGSSFTRPPGFSDLIASQKLSLTNRSRGPWNNLLDNVHNDPCLDVWAEEVNGGVATITNSAALGNIFSKSGSIPFTNEKTRVIVDLKEEVDRLDFAEVSMADTTLESFLGADYISISGYADGIDIGLGPNGTGVAGAAEWDQATPARSFHHDKINGTISSFLITKPEAANFRYIVFEFDIAFPVRDGGAIREVRIERLMAHWASDLDAFVNRNTDNTINGEISLYHRDYFTTTIANINIGDANLGQSLFFSRRTELATGFINPQITVNQTPSFKRGATAKFYAGHNGNGFVLNAGPGVTLHNPQNLAPTKGQFFSIRQVDDLGLEFTVIPGLI